MIRGVLRPAAVFLRAAVGRWTRRVLSWIRGGAGGLVTALHDPREDVWWVPLPMKADDPAALFVYPPGARYVRLERCPMCGGLFSQPDAAAGAPRGADATPNPSPPARPAS